MSTSPEDLQNLSPLKRALLAVQEMRAKLEGIEKARTEPIAIVGMGCRFPGGANDPEAYWRLLRDGVDAITEIPKSRWDIDALYDADPEAPGKMSTRWGGFLERLDQFDQYFFGISPREAAAMDPQQRMLLEVAWEALEDGGQATSRLASSLTGVFVGICNSDYARLQYGNRTGISTYHATGGALNMVAGRLSYLFDLRGPAVAVDTACSSSLVALHLAVQSLRNRECDMALAGGVSAIVSPEQCIAFSKMRMFASDGRCKTFDARADGFVGGEGCGVVVLKRLSDAVAAGDRIVAVIRGSAINQDGKSAGLTAPNVLAQQAVIRAALANAGVEPERVGYVEAHGTGTSLGDPIEVEALTATLGKPRADGSECALGSVKANFGHLEAAAGVASLIKAALALKHGEIPPHLHFKQLNPSITLEGTPFVVSTQLKEWRGGDKPRVAGVSSFGWSGTNAHVVLEEGPKAEAPEAKEEGRAYVVPVSAKSPEALKALAGQYARALSQGGLGLGDMAYTAGERRGQHEHRGAVVGRGVEQVVQRLEALERGEAGEGVVSGRKPPQGRRKVVFVFPGQGGQWKGMGRRLLEQEPVFRRVLEQCEAAMKPYVEWSLLEVLEGKAEEGRIDVIQPALFAMGVGLAEVWKSWGVEPDAVVGHSMGEVAAACVAGVLSLEEAARVICVRSRLLRTVSGQGAMGVVELTAEQAAEELKGYEDRLSVAVSNSARSTVLSGQAQALEEVLEKLKQRGVFCRPVKVDVASHSPQMDALRERLVEGLKGLAPKKGKVALFSTVRGQLESGEGMGAEYWVDNLRQPVRFHSALKGLMGSGHEVFVEMGPHPVLLPAVEETLGEQAVAGLAVGSLRRQEDEEEVLRGALAAVYAQGCSVDWGKVNPKGRCVRLPTYPFQRERYWMEEAKSQGRRLGGSGHPLLGRHQQLAVPQGMHLWETELSAEWLPFLGDHRIQGTAVLPVSVYAEMALVAGTEALGSRPVVEQLRFSQALSLPDEGSVQVQVVLTTEAQGAASFQIFSRSADPAAETSATGWTLNASGRLRADKVEEGVIQVARSAPEEIRARCGEAISSAEHYEAMVRRGLEYGPSFQGVEQLWRREGEALGRVSLPKAAGAKAGDYQVHPALLDACIQVLFAALPKQSAGAGLETFLPVELGGLRARTRPGERLWCHAVLHPDAEGSGTTLGGDVSLLDEQGQVVLEVRGFRAHRLVLSARQDARDELSEWLYAVKWQPEPLAAVEPGKARRGSWLVFTDSGGVGTALHAGLEAKGEACVRVSVGEGFEQVEPGHYRVNPGRLEDFKRLLAEAFGPGQPACRGVVHLWSLERVSAGAPGLESLEAARELCGVSALHLVQAVVQSGARDMPRLWLVTAGAQAVDPGESCAVEQALLAGLSKAVVYEHPELRPSLVDLGTESPISQAPRLLEELWADGPQDTVALRASGRYVARLSRAEALAPPQAPGVRSEGTYLITGGLGTLGLRVSRWLVEQGARHLVLVARGAPAAQAQQQVEALRAVGAQVRLAQADVTQLEALAQVLREVAQDGPPLRGVLHLAGHREELPLRRLEARRFARSLAPRVMGAWNLHSLTREAALDFFVLFSSSASLLGAPGHGGDAAGEAFLAALAHHRRALGLPALSLHWAPWAQEGASEAEVGRGLGSLVPERALEVLGRVLGQGRTQLGVMPLNVRQWRQYYPKAAQWPFLAELAREEERSRRKSVSSSQVLQALRAAAPRDRGMMLEEHLREQITQVLLVASSRLEAETPLTSLGLDSLMALKLRNRLEASLGLTLPTTLLWRYPTVAALVPHLAGKLELPLEAAEPSASRLATPEPAHESLAQELEKLSQDELAAMLAQELADIEESSR